MANEPFAKSEPEQQQRNWVPIVVGLVLVVLIVAAIAIVGRNRENPGAQQDPYSSNLQIGNIQLSAADNFVGGTVTYLDIPVTNSGNKTLVGGQMEATLRNSLNEIVQKETVPIKVMQPNQLGGYADLADLATSPLGPGQTKTVRLTLEHVSGDWNQTAPELRFLNLRFK
jgi:hypothetical protein